MSGSSSPLSSLSSAPPTDDEMPSFMLNDEPVDASSPSDASSSPAAEKTTPKRKRPVSPPHEEVLADNPDIAFIVMFRSRFNDIFPPKLIQFGPQDIERGVVDSMPSPQVESLLCAILALVLNRKKPIERGHHGRALEEAIQTNKSQWPRAWKSINPLHGGRSFNTMSPQERLTLMKALIMWSLHNSEAVNAVIKESYKQSRHDDDLNQPLSVQPWGRDGDKRRYWLIEGRDDTPFRLYRESNPALKHNTWWSVAGSIEELHVVAQKLEEDGTQAARRLAQRVKQAIPRFEATEEKRKRREYRLARKAQFTRPEPGFSLYEGRTRGKRMRYTFSDDEDEDDLSESVGNRRSTRNSGAATPADPSRPTVTASGRQVRSRLGGIYGESLLSGQTSTGRASPATDAYERSDASEEPPAHGHATRAARSDIDGWSKSRKHIQGYNSVDEMEDEDDATSSGNEWDGGDEEEPDNVAGEDEDEEMSEEVYEDNAEPKSLVVTLRYGKGANGNMQPPSSAQAPRNGGPLPTPATEPQIPKAVNIIPPTAAPAPVTNGYLDSLPPPTPLPTIPKGYSVPTRPPVATQPPALPISAMTKTEPLKQAATTLPYTAEVAASAHAIPSMQQTGQTPAEAPINPAGPQAQQNPAPVSSSS